MAMKGSKTSGRRIRSAERAAKAMDLRRAGATFKQIGSALKVTEQRAHQIITRELARVNAKLDMSREAVRQMENDRLDSLWSAMYPQARAGDPAAVNSCIRIMERRSKLLGTDAPARLETTGKAGGPIKTESKSFEVSKLSDEQYRKFKQLVGELSGDANPGGDTG